MLHTLKMRLSRIKRNLWILSYLKTLFVKFLMLLVFCLVLTFCAIELVTMFLVLINGVHIRPSSFYDCPHTPSYQRKRIILGNDGLQVDNYNYSVEQIPSTFESSDKAKRKTNFRENISHSNKRKAWMRISDEVFVYSAHLDTRNFSKPPMKNNLTSDESNSDSDKLKRVILVRIVGMKAVPPLREFIKNGKVLDWFRIKHEMEFSQKYECKLLFPQYSLGHASHKKFEKLQFLQSTRVTYTIIEEGVKMYAGCYFNCYFTMDKNSSILDWADSLQVAMYPKQVADYPIKLIDVSGLMTKTEQNVMSKSIGVCVRPLFGPYDDLLKLIQFISYYYTMGITKFSFYLMSISPQSRKYLRELSEISKNEGETLPRFILNDWNLPTGNTSELWDYGTLAALNDCLFSNVDQEFVLFVDVDEFIVPQMGLDHSVAPLWSIINSYNRSRIYQYLIRNTFFCHEFCQLENILTSHPEVTKRSTISFDRVIDPVEAFPIFSCTTRTKRIWNVAVRSKFIVNPRKVLAVGHHLVTKYLDANVDFRFTSGFSVQVDPAIAIMNHYRECSSISSKTHPILTRVKERDETILKYEGEVKLSLEKWFLPSK